MRFTRIRLERGGPARCIGIVSAMAGLLAAQVAHADVVSPCPPMFHPSHQGCQWRPSTVEIVVACGVLLAVAAIVAVFAFSRKSADRE